MQKPLKHVFYTSLIICFTLSLSFFSGKGYSFDDGAGVKLRSAGKEVSKKDVKEMLLRYRFFATCWNYNTGFCNPDGDFKNRFVDNRDGTVTDHAIGLMWQQKGTGKKYSWIEAKLHASIVNQKGFAGHKDWRIPTIEELASLMEKSWMSEGLFIDPVFKNTGQSCWSLDTMGVSRAWKANFHTGQYLDSPMISDNSILLVR